MKITVPATSANIGPGFDSVGVAVSKYLTIEVLEPADVWFIEHDLGDIPSDENREHCRRQYLQRQTPEGYLPAGLLPWQKELQCSGNGMQPDTVPYKGESPAGKRSERVFFPASAR